MADTESLENERDAAYERGDELDEAAGEEATAENDEAAAGESRSEADDTQEGLGVEGGPGGHES